jgi:hypothetical protein
LRSIAEFVCPLAKPFVTNVILGGFFPGHLQKNGTHWII